MLLGRRGEGHLELLILQAAVELGHQQIDDVGDVVLGEGLVEHNLVQPVEELGPEGVVQQIVDGIFRLGGDVALLIDAVQQVLGPQVGGEDDNGVLESPRFGLDCR